MKRVENFLKVFTPFMMGFLSGHTFKTVDMYIKYKKYIDG